MKLCFRFTYCGLHRVVKLRFLKLFGPLRAILFGAMDSTPLLFIITSEKAQH